MFGTLKDLLLYAYKCTEKMEEQAVEIHARREKRMQEFREKFQSAREDIDRKWEAQKDKRRADFKRMVEETGVATKQDIDDLRATVQAINEQVEKLAGQGK